MTNQRKISVINALINDLQTLVPDEKFDMAHWYGNMQHYDLHHAVSEERGSDAVDAQTFLHACGTAACLAGWAPVLPSMRAEARRLHASLKKHGHGIRLIPWGNNKWAFLYASDAIARLLGISRDEAAALTADGASVLAYPHRDYVSEITRQDVIEVLKKLADGKQIIPSE